MQATNKKQTMKELKNSITQKLSLLEEYGYLGSKEEFENRDNHDELLIECCSEISMLEKRLKNRHEFALSSASVQKPAEKAENIAEKPSKTIKADEIKEQKEQKEQKTELLSSMSIMLNKKGEKISYKAALNLAKEDGLYSSPQNNTIKTKISYAQALNQALTIDMPTQSRKLTAVPTLSQRTQANSQIQTENTLNMSNNTTQMNNNISHPAYNTQPMNKTPSLKMGR